MIQRSMTMLAFVLIIGLLAACSSTTEKGEVPTIVEIKNRIEQAVDLSEMKQQDINKLEKLYHIEAKDIEDFVFYTATSNVKADELAIIKVKDASKIADVMEQIEQRVQTQTVKFKGYRPEEYYLLEKHVAKAKGVFIFFAVSKQVDAMEEAYDSAWK